MSTTEPPTASNSSRATEAYLPDELLARLIELQPFAQSVRSSSLKYRAEAEEYTKLLHEAHVGHGVSIYRLAKLLGVTHSALRFRLIRYGYKSGPDSSNPIYKPIKQRNRWSSE